MTSRERVYKAIRRQPVDRMPIDLGCHFSTGISVVAYWNLCKFLGYDISNIEMVDCVQCLARVEDIVAERFHIDTVLLNPPWADPWRWTMRAPYTFTVPDTFRPQLRADGAWVMTVGGANGGGDRLDGNSGDDGSGGGDGGGSGNSGGGGDGKSDANGGGAHLGDANGHASHLMMPAGGFFFDGSWPSFSNLRHSDNMRLYAERAKRLYEETDRFTMYMGFGAYFDGLDFACDMLTDPDKCKAQNEEALRSSIEHYDDVNRMFGRYIGAVVVNSDLGMQTGPMCSPASYEEVCYPYLKRFCDHVHATSDLKVFLHSCGSVAKLLPLIVDAGVDILNPVQISAADMDAGALKAAFGDKLTFWGGGCDTQRVLWASPPDEIVAHVRGQIAALKPGSGFVFNMVHNIMGNVPPENVVAMLDTAYEESWY